MAQENVGININVQGNAVESIGNVKKALKEANAELINAQSNFGDYSQEAVAAAKKVAELKDKISEAKETADLFDPGKKFQVLAGAATAVAGGFTAVQGALGLLGVESEEVEKSLLKVQSALALSQGLSTITDSAKDFKRLGVVASDAFKAIKVGIGSTGIGVLVLALGAIVAYWDDIKEAVTGVSEEQKKLLTDTQADAKAQQEKLSAIDSQDNVLKLQGKSEKEILGLKIKQTDAVIAATEKQVQQQKIVLQAQIASDKKNKEILQGILRFILAPISAILSTVDQVGKVLGKDFNLEKKFSGGLAGLVFDAKATEKKGNEEIAALDKTLADLKNKRAGYQLSIQNIDKQAASTKKGNADKLAEEENARYEKQLADEKKLTEDLLAEYEKRRKFRLTSRTITQEELAALDKEELEENKKKQEAIDNERVAGQMKVMSATKNFALQGIQAQQAAAATEAEIEKQKTDNKLKEFELQKAGAMAALDAVAGLIDQNSVAGKAIAVAKAIMSTYEGATKALGTYPPPFGQIAAAATIAGGLINVKKIISTNIPSAKGTGSVGGGATAPSISSAAPIAPPQPQAATTNISAQSINALGNQATRAYVVESDVTNSQQRMAAIQQRARFG
jgi:hypothetical protein